MLVVMLKISTAKNSKFQMIPESITFWHVLCQWIMRDGVKFWNHFVDLYFYCRINSVDIDILSFSYLFITQDHNLFIFMYFILCRLHRIYHNYHHHTNGFSFHSSVVYVAIEADLIDILKVPSSELRITGVIGGRLKLFVIGVLERRSLHKRSL